MPAAFEANLATSVFASAAHDYHEQVVFCAEPGFRAVIAVHSTALGPALGGCRIRAYPDEATALTDVLRLSRGMSLKAAAAGLPFGGGKMVVLADPERDKSPELLGAVARAVDRLGGRYVTGEDVGTTVADMSVIRTCTPHVMGMPEEQGGSGDPSPRTAAGCLVAIRAAAQHRWGSPDLGGLTVAVQGLGNVGWHLAEMLFRVGAELVVSDLREDRLAAAREAFGARSVPTDSLLESDVDVLAPCALGAVLDDRSIPRIAAEVVAGAANNQLADEEVHGESLRARGILYVPDFVANAGGMIQLALERSGSLEWPEVERRVAAIADSLAEVFERADAQGTSTAAAARRLAEERIAYGSAR